MTAKRPRSVKKVPVLSAADQFATIHGRLFKMEEHLALIAHNSFKLSFLLAAGGEQLEKLTQAVSMGGEAAGKLAKEWPDIVQLHGLLATERNNARVLANRAKFLEAQVVDNKQPLALLTRLVQNWDEPLDGDSFGEAMKDAKAFTRGKP